MSYNWERAPYPWERHRMGFAVLAAIAVLGLMVGWSLY